MNKKVNDILKNLNIDIDISETYTPKQLDINKLTGKSIIDINSFSDNIDLGTNKYPHIHKSTTSNFDSIVKYKNSFNDINLNLKKSRVKSVINSTKTISKKPIKFIKNRFIFTKSFFKNTFIIISLFILLLFIDKYFVENKINSGYNKLLSIKDNSGDITYIQNSINDAKMDFVVGNILFKPFKIIPNHNVINGFYVLQGGLELTKILDRSVQIYLSTKDFLDNNGGFENVKLTNLLYNLKSDFSEITGLLYNAIIYYNGITDLNDNELSEKLNFAKSKLNDGYKFLDIINRDFDIFLNLLGHKNERNYLILFQNNDEIRPTGGFIGSLATVTIKDGKISNFVKDDIYAYEWEINKLLTNKNPAPEGLNKITNTFGLRDSNYFASFEDSSRSIKSFLDVIDKQVDGIIYINQNTVLDLLKYTGGVEFPLLGETITEENFSIIISTLVESQSFKVGTLSTPKQILFDFTTIFLEKLKYEKDYYGYLDVIINNIKSRDIVFYSFNSDENNLLWKLGLNGKINYSDTLDFSYPYFTSIGGNKSDRYIEIKYKKNIIHNSDCSISTSLDIYRTHHFSKSIEKQVINLIDKYPIKDKSRKDIINIQGKGDNYSFVRIILPKDAIVDKKPGLKIIKNDSYTFLEYYHTARPTESTHYDINYKIPNKNCKKYDYKFYKQPGIKKYEIEINEGSESIIKKEIKGDFIYN